MGNMLIIALLIACLYPLSLLILRIVYKPKLAMEGRFERYITSLDVQQEDIKKSKGLDLGSIDWEKILTKFRRGKAYANYLDSQLEMGSINLRVNEFITIAVFAVLAVGILGYLLLNSLLGMLLFMILGAIIPHTILSIKCQSRIKAFRKQIPETLVLIANGMRAGYSFLQALNIVRQEMPAPMSEEFARLIEETSLGIPIDEALKAMGDRMNDEDFNLVITAVIIQRSAGGNLAEVLTNIEHTIRERIKVKNEIKVLTAQGKLTAVILVLLPILVSLAIYMMNPEYITTLFVEPVGRMMLGAGLLLMVFGTLVIKRIVTIKV